MNPLELRNAMNKKRPAFIRQDTHKKKRLAIVWRKPKGIHSKLRHAFKGHGHLVRAGYRGPAKARGLTRKGMIPVLISSPAAMDALDPKTNIATISSGTGMRKRLEIANAAVKRKISITNMKDPAGFIEQTRKAMQQRKEAKKPKPAGAQAAPTAAPAKPASAAATETKPTTEADKEKERREAEKVMIKRET
ncbi:hypothetical protein HY642_07225 [Candidatus Woesearchaeota archaeon]|nr:hypothetical protein [Candidatus Woesearchaeota archaeon]